MSFNLMELKNQFALDLYQAVTKSCSGNILVSPVGLQIPLAMALQGAEGPTAAEIAEVSHLPQDKLILRLSCKSLIAALDVQSLKLATTIFIEKTHQTSPAFQNIMKEYFLSELQGVDFFGNPAGSSKEINDWVGEKTEQKIKEFLPIDLVNGISSLVLVSGAYFETNWSHKFKQSKTRDMAFYIQPNLTVNAQMMFLKEKPLCTMKSEKLEAQIVELPLAQQYFAMIIILPNRVDGLAAVETKLKSLDLLEELSQLWISKVDVYLPKFKLEQATHLNQVLSEMGMPTAFTDEADFSGISADPLLIGHVVQKACIDVQEEGSESSKDRAFPSYNNAPLKVTAEVKCDHPFLFTILAKNEILLVGRLQNPDEV